MSREGRSQPVQPTAWHGFVDPGPGPVGTTPPPPVNVDRVDQRARYLPLPPILLVGVPADQFVATATPPAPFVVPVEERRRFLANIPPEVSVGFDNVAPAKLIVSEAETRRRLPGDPFLVNSALIAATVVAAPGIPPKLIVVELDDQRRRRLTFDPFFADSGLYAATVPPLVSTATPLRALLGVGT